MNLEEIFECLNDGYETDSYGRTVVTAALAQELILQAANLHKPKWINSTEQLPKTVNRGRYEASENVMVYIRGEFRVAYVVFVAGNDPKSGYHWVFVEDESDYHTKIDGTYWMPLPNKPKV